MKFRFSIRTKLVGIINAIVIAAAAAIVIFATNLFSKDNLQKFEYSNLESTRLLAQEIRNDLTNLTEKMRLLGMVLLQPLSPSQLEGIRKPFFDQEKDLLAGTVYSLTEVKPKILSRASNDPLLKSMEIPLEDILRLQAAIPEASLRSGMEFIQSGQIKGNIPVVTVLVPLMTDDKGDVSHAVMATLRQDRFLRAVSGDGLTTSYLVDSQGFLLAHPDQQRVLKRENVSHLKIVKEMISGKAKNQAFPFEDPTTATPYLGAYELIGFAGVGVVSQVETAKALEAARKVRNISIIITGMVSVIAFLIIYFFGLSLTRPLIGLAAATEEVAKGNYSVELKPAANDEIGDLTTAFSHMTLGLAEREKIKNAFSKFHSKDVADKILSGELMLTGERKKVAIFFSDIRSFTSISEGLEPEQVVELVNSYMTRMVRIIFAHGGVVDKYVGDAIMAVYGAPVAHGDDSLRAVSAALRMRAEMKRYNESQAAAGKPVIAIGMGMHTGDVVAGNIGSPERMEYTILGDNVNLTSRMESLTKEYKTDILVSAATYEEIKDHIYCERRASTKVKGKAEEVAVYEVMGFIEGREYIPPETGSTGETEDLAHGDGSVQSAPIPLTAANAPAPQVAELAAAEPATRIIVPPPPPAEAIRLGARHADTQVLHTIQAPPPPVEAMHPELLPIVEDAEFDLSGLAAADITGSIIRETPATEEPATEEPAIAAPLEVTTVELVEPPSDSTAAESDDDQKDVA